MADLPWGSHRLAGALVAQLWGLSLSPWRCLMATTIPSAALVPVTPVFSNTERLALAGFLVGYIGLTRQAYELDLRQYAAWCSQHQLRRIPARRQAPGLAAGHGHDQGCDRLRPAGAR